MWAKSILTPMVLIPSLVVLQMSYGKPTEDLQSVRYNNTTTEMNLLVPANSTESDGDGGADAHNNSSFLLQTLSVLLKVLSPNDTSSDSTSLSPTFLLNANANSSSSNSNSTEPEYYLVDDETEGELNSSRSNSTELSSSPSSSRMGDSSTISGLEDDFDTLSMHIGVEPTDSTSLITKDEMDVAGSLDEVVTASVVTGVREDRAVPVDSDTNTRSSTKEGDGARENDDDDENGNHEEDDSIIVASMGSSSSNLNVDTVEPPLSHAENEVEVLKNDESSDATELITSTYLKQGIIEASPSSSLLSSESPYNPSSTLPQ